MSDVEIVARGLAKGAKLALLGSVKHTVYGWSCVPENFRAYLSARGLLCKAPCRSIFGKPSKRYLLTKLGQQVRAYLLEHPND